MKKASENYSVLMLGLLTFLFLPFTLLGQPSSHEEIELLRKRVIKDALTEKGFLPRVSSYLVPDFTKATQYLSELQPDGSWASVDYLDTDNNWDPLQALDKILVMSYAYSHPDDPEYRNKDLLNGIERALAYWYKVNPTCVNWYKNDIAKQIYFGVISILLQDHIQEHLIQKLIKDQTASPSMTGSNTTLLSTSVFYRGILEKNTDRISIALKAITDQVKISQNEGIQADYSFHQHGPYLYNGGYGSGFLRETLWIAAMVQGTQFEFSKNQLKILRDYYFEGTRLMLRRARVDYNVRGRQVGRTASNGANLISQLNYFIKADPTHAMNYEKSKNLLASKEPQEFVGNKHFWKSDYTVHQRPHYFTSLRMCSERTVGVETHVNYENLLGRNIPYGLTYIYRSGDEYKGIFPMWDWAKLPGVTSSYEVPSKKGKYSQEVDFVGGVSDGNYGVSTMDLDLRKTTAKKSWFWFDQEWLALGAGISSDNKNTIVTGINQTTLLSKVLINGRENKNENIRLSGPSWVWQDSVAYIFPSKTQNLHLEAKKKSGSMKRIYGLSSDSLLQKEVFTLWFDHGIQPKNETYEYIVVPGLDSKEVQKYVETKPISVLANNTKIQAATHTKTGITGIVFHKSSSIQIAQNLKVTSSKPCILLINHKTKQVSISDPTTKLTDLIITFESKIEGMQELKVQLPQNQNAGKTITLLEEIKGL